MAKTTFGTVDSLVSETPKWAKWMFRIFILLTTVVTFVIAGDNAIAGELKLRILLYLKGADLFVLGLSKMFGVEVPASSSFENPSAPGDAEITNKQ